jgi:hypothetical protein
MKLGPEHRLILENQLSILHALRMTIVGLADRGMLTDKNGAFSARLNVQVIRTSEVIGRANREDIVERERREHREKVLRNCHLRSECLKGTQQCICAGEGI